MISIAAFPNNFPQLEHKRHRHFNIQPAPPTTKAIDVARNQARLGRRPSTKQSSCSRVIFGLVLMRFVGYTFPRRGIQGLFIAGIALATFGTTHAPAAGDLPLEYSEGEPCAAFTENAEYVDFSLLMGLEGREVDMRIPKTFLEDRWKQQNGAQHTALLFRVMIDSFRPVTRRETPSLNFEYMRFLIRDVLELPKIAEIQFQRANPGSNRRSVSSMPFAEDITPFNYDLVPFRYGLNKIAPLAGDVQDDIYLSISNEKPLAAVISCDTPEWVQFPGCEQFFVSHTGVDIKLSYRIKYLPLWADMENDVETFLRCATQNNSE